MGRATTLALALALLPGQSIRAASEPDGAPYAAAIDESNFARALRGPDADAGIGDWMLSNGTLCASISAPAHETYLSTTGGSLIDLGYCGRHDDQWAAYHDLANLDREAVFAATAIDGTADANEASVTVLGAWGGLERRTRYVLDRSSPEELRIETTIRRIRESPALGLFGSIVMHANASLTPFVVSTTDPAWSKGFVHPRVDRNDQRAMAQLLFPADLSVMVGPDSGAPPISYGLLSDPPVRVEAGGERTSLRQFAIDDDDFSLVGGFSDAPWFDTEGHPGLLQLAQSKLMDLDVGDSLEIRRRILVAPRADVAGITDRVYTGALLQGRAGSAEDRVLVTDPEGHPLSFVRPGSDGAFALRLPAGMDRVRLVLNTPERESAQQVEAVAGDTVTLAGSEPRMATLALPAQGVPMQLEFRGRNGTPDPVFASHLRGFRVGRKSNSGDSASSGISLTGTGSDPFEVRLPAGEYTVYATRGPEYSLESTQLELSAGASSQLGIKPPRRVLTSKTWISADLHVHSERSFDSTLPARSRIAAFVAQGGEVMVSTEHKRAVDHQPLIEQMGLASLLVSVTGTELTGMAHGDRIARTIGHSNVFPVVAQPKQFQSGVPAHENRRLGEVIATHKALDPRVVFQLNHPRNSANPVDDIYFFNHLSVDRPFDASVPLEAETNRSLIEALPGTTFRDVDFDAIEIMNGPWIDSYRMGLKDWFALLLQGHRSTATGNSDSHGAADVTAMPRNYVRTRRMRIDEEAVERFDSDGFLEAIRGGRLFVSTGPLLDVRLDGHGPGATISGHHADLSIRVRAADWVPVERLRVYVNGRLVREAPASRHGTHEISLDFARDSFVVVEVEGTPRGAYRAVYPDYTPIAFTNPVWVDADGDGRWTPPGLGSR